MSKKQIRITGSSKVNHRLPAFLNKKINIVLADSTVLYGLLFMVGTDAIEIKNMRGKFLTIAKKNIQELYADIDA